MFGEKLLSEVIKTAMDILEFEYKNYRENKIRNKERFKEANIKMRTVLRSCLIRLNLTKAHNLFVGEKLANIVPKIALELDKIAIETQDILSPEVIDGIQKLSEAFVDYNNQVSIFNLPTTSSVQSTTALEGDEKLDGTYSINELIQTLEIFINKVEEFKP